MIDKELDIANFKRIEEQMVAKNSSAWNNSYSRSVRRLKDYTLEEIENIINSSSLIEQQKIITQLL